MKGVLLVNLGSPEAPTPEAVKPYLDEFLMDERVIDLPYWLRWFVVRQIILRTRPKKSAEAYKKIWWEEGSPLIVISKRTQEKVQKLTELPVELAMRYGKPSIEEGLRNLSNKGVTEVFLMSLYPQYAMSTTQTIEVLADELVKKQFPQMKLTKLQPFYNNQDYIKNISAVIAKALSTYDYDCLLFSYHGLPERHLRKTDETGKHKKTKFVDQEYCCEPGTPEAATCYRTHCMETTRQIVETLGIPKEKYALAFQSRLGMDKWITPYTADTVVELGKKGIKKLAVVTPAFVSDCIETLEEIEMAAGESFKENGGEEFRMIPCLNDDDEWTKTLASWINDWNKK